MLTGVANSELKPLKEFTYFFKLPQEIQFLILEEYLLDFINPTPNAFPLATKACRNLAFNPQFGKYIIQKYYPFLMAHPDYAAKPFDILIKHNDPIFRMSNITLSLSPNPLRELYNFNAPAEEFLIDNYSNYLKRLNWHSILKGKYLKDGLNKTIAFIQDKFPDLHQQFISFPSHTKPSADAQLRTLSLEELKKPLSVQFFKYLQVMYFFTTPSLRDAHVSFFKMQHYRACQTTDVSGLNKMIDWNFQTAIKTAMKAGNLKLVFALLNPALIVSASGLAQVRWAAALAKRELAEKSFKRYLKENDSGNVQSNEQLNLMLQHLNNAEWEHFTKLLGLSNHGEIGEIPMSVQELDCWDFSVEFKHFTLEHFEIIFSKMHTLPMFLISQAIKVGRVDLLSAILKKECLPNDCKEEIVKYFEKENKVVSSVIPTPLNIGLQLKDNTLTAAKNYLPSFGPPLKRSAPSSDPDEVEGKRPTKHK